jgi:hypothetical protein
VVEEHIHDCDSRLLHVWCHVGIDTQRDRNIRMAEHLADDLGMNTAAEQEGGGRIAQVMKAYIRQSGFR